MLALAAGLILSAPATGQAPVAPGLTAQNLQAAFAQGRFAEVAREAQRLDSADARALAARALLAEAMCGEGEPSPELIAHAEREARAALALQPDHVEGRLQLAIALSLKVRPLSNREAWRSGEGEVARDLAEAVLADDPGNPYAHGLLAIWHVEVVRRGGRFGAGLMGASIDRGFAHYRQAVMLAPGDASIHWQMARALAAHDPKRYQDDIRAALDAALAAPCDDALETVMAARAELLRDAFETGGRKHAARVARTLL